jgi:hypothetical protein
MTSRLPPERLGAERAAMPMAPDPTRVAGDIFIKRPDWQKRCALAALYRMRPDLGQPVDDDDHAAHMLTWPRDERYFLCLCKLLKWFGVGSDWGHE